MNQTTPIIYQPLTAKQTLCNGRYEIINRLSSGGQGTVYRAKDTYYLPHQTIYVAIKENIDTSPQAKKRFVREASLLKLLSHPRLPDVADHFTQEVTGVAGEDALAGRQYIVMDFIDGALLRCACRIEDCDEMCDSIGNKISAAKECAMLDMVIDKTEDVQALVAQFANNEVGMLITLFQLTDHWPTGAASTTLQKSHVHVLRVHLHRLFEYYFDLAQENKAKLATTLHATTFFAERQGLTHMQIATIQLILTYFQRVSLTIDDLRSCSRTLREHGIETTPVMPNWQATIADH